MKIIALVVILLSCGREEPAQPVQPIPPANPGGGVTPPPGGQLSFADIQPDLDRYCSACHGGLPFLTSANAFRQSKSADLIYSRDMPPNSRLPEEVYQKLNRFR